MSRFRMPLPTLRAAPSIPIRALEQLESAGFCALPGGDDRDPPERAVDGVGEEDVGLGEVHLIGAAADELR
jgi:hypothetical protein